MKKHLKKMIKVLKILQLNQQKRKDLERKKIRTTLTKPIMKMMTTMPPKYKPLQSKFQNKKYPNPKTLNKIKITKIITITKIRLIRSNNPPNHRSK